MRPDDLLDGGKRKMPSKPKGSRKQPRKSPATESPQTEMVPVKPVPREWDQMEDREMCLSVVNKANQMTVHIWSYNDDFVCPRFADSSR